MPSCWWSVEGRCGDGEVRRTLQRNMPALLELFKGTGQLEGPSRPGAGGQLQHPAQIHTHHLLQHSAYDRDQLRRRQLRKVHGVCPRPSKYDMLPALALHGAVGSTRRTPSLT